MCPIILCVVNQPRATNMLPVTQQPTEPPITACPTDVAFSTGGGATGVSVSVALCNYKY